LSEPVFAGPDAADVNLVKNPFSYCFGRSQRVACSNTNIDNTERFSQTYNNLDWSWELPAAQDYYATNVIYRPNTKGLNTMAQPGAKGDSIVELTYYAYSGTRMPKLGDWIKIRADAAVFQDAEGNVVNPRERGVLISSFLTTPIITAPSLAGNIIARTKGNSILLENVPAGAKIELYNLQGKRIYSAYPENPQILKIGVQTNGMYIVNVSFGSENTVLKVPLAGR